MGMFRFEQNLNILFFIWELMILGFQICYVGIGYFMRVLIRFFIWMDGHVSVLGDI
jgi:hypothetical protein